jgi:glycerol-3-phosphate dehydrogenase (NAD(P)+)
MASRIAVIGAGSWGTALSTLLARHNDSIALHCYPDEIAKGITATRHNPSYFPEVELPPAVVATADLAEALADAASVYLVVPTRYLRGFISKELDIWRSWANPERVLCNCAKGLLLDPAERTDVWLAGLLPEVPLTHLAGPNFARELITGKPAAAVVAGPEDAASRIQQELMSNTYRIYTGDDPVGVEVAGFYKNVIAIAAGAIDELGIGNNARAALITRALAEMGRLVEYFGGNHQTLMGLAGVGDLTLTCSSKLSRNFQVGIRRARGESLDEILAGMSEVAEGIQASAALHSWPEEHGLDGWPELPIAAEVYRFVHENADPYSSLLNLMERPPKSE